MNKKQAIKWLNGGFRKMNSFSDVILNAIENEKQCYECGGEYPVGYCSGHSLSGMPYIYIIDKIKNPS